jgi:hypothetical protein
MDRHAQLNAFAEGLARQTTLPRLSFDSWPQAFQVLRSQLTSDKNTVLLFDEISWMAIGDADFPGHLKNAWDEYFATRPGLIVVLCGSVSSWISRNILENTGFVGRASWTLDLKPLGLPECNAFWNKAKNVSAREKLTLLSVTGGVPRYLEEVVTQQSAEQNIERLCFTEGGLLVGEFDQIFHDIFSRRAETYRDIARTLVGGPKTLSGISKELERVKGGSLGDALSDLHMAGFIAKDTAIDLRTGRPRPRAIRYRLSDNYVRFYLKYVEGMRPRIAKGLYQHAPLETLTAWDTIVGLQFENLVLQSIDPLLSRLGLDNVPVLDVGPYWQTKAARRNACQVDVLARSKRAVYLLEVKFRNAIPKSVVNEMQEKVSRLALPSSVTVRTGLIYEGELHPDVRKADYFDHLIPFAQLLEGGTA